MGTEEITLGFAEHNKNVDFIVSVMESHWRVLRERSGMRPDLGS